MRSLGTLTSDEDEETFLRTLYPARRTSHGLPLCGSNNPKPQASQNVQIDLTVSDSQSAWIDPYGDAANIARAATALCNMQDNKVDELHDLSHAPENFVGSPNSDFIFLDAQARAYLAESQAGPVQDPETHSSFSRMSGLDPDSTHGDSQERQSTPIKREHLERYRTDPREDLIGSSTRKSEESLTRHDRLFDFDEGYGDYSMQPAPEHNTRAHWEQAPAPEHRKWYGSIQAGITNSPYGSLHAKQYQGIHCNNHNSPATDDYDSVTPLIEVRGRGRIRQSTPFLRIAGDQDQKPEEDYDSDTPLIETRGRRIRQSTPFPSIARDQHQRPSCIQSHFSTEEEYDSDTIVVADPDGKRRAPQRPIGPLSNIVLGVEAAQKSGHTQTAIKIATANKKSSNGTNSTVGDLTINTTANASLYPTIRTNGHSLVDRQANEDYIFRYGASLLRTIGRNITRVRSISKSHPNLNQPLKKVAENVVLAKGGSKFAPHLNQELTFDVENAPKEIEVAAKHMKATKTAFSLIDGGQNEWNWGLEAWKGKKAKVSKPKPKLRSKLKTEKTEAQKDVVDLMKDLSTGFVDLGIKSPSKKWNVVNDNVEGANVPLVDNATGRDLFSSGDGMDVDDGTVLIKKDETACSNENRLRIQGEGSSNVNLLKFPAGSCLRSSCPKEHKPWTTVGNLVLPGCAQCCEICGYVVDGPACKVRAHVKSFHMGPDFNPAAKPKDRILYLSVEKGSAKAYYPKHVREWMNRTGRPASEYVLPEDHPRYRDWKEGRTNKWGFLKPQFKRQAGIKSEGKGKRKCPENGKGRDDYIERNKNVKFLPGMFISEKSKRKFPQYDAQVGLHKVEEDDEDYKMEDEEDHKDGEMSGAE